MTELDQRHSKVAIVTSRSYGEETKAAVRTAADMIGGIDKIVHSGDTVLIKPNLVNIYSAESGNTTHSSLVEPLIEACYQNGASQIFVGDGSSEFETEAAFIISGIKKIVKRLQHNGVPVKTVDLNRDKNPKTNEFDTVHLGKEGAHPNHIYGIAHTVLSSDVLISVPKLKSHSLAGISVALKNMIGIAPGEYYGYPKRRNESLPHGSFRSPMHNDVIWRTIHDLNKIALGNYVASPKKRRYMAVVDGIVAGSYDKVVPLGDDFWMAAWKPTRVGVVMAGFDPVAVDTVAARVMCYRPEKIPAIAHAAECGLGTMSNIEILGERIENVRTFVPQSTGFLSMVNLGMPRLWPKSLSVAIKSNASERVSRAKYFAYGLLKKHSLVYSN
ncbi:DUF362 domain-containing protein [Candidatus Bathyarchaeota archaeon A05DMB-2]|jgi:uncharacterized protein (DUF362 family)|nr:DUF362 domain-containing protein [Candidatus Bathyarchaeota archaeon A05DMB-2]